ncbi:MAG TPA: (2Fe-2S)-binding protein [Polyangiaceae bacterium LLY-WYZ-15_(1-7)]|nr:(2Fe-2S)-binding protein [Myxococcales bacterium]MAT23820.1 (2Fe-2S)-binding protein [Sandaracinus sp.]HJK93732.1 (2Fe-2S)-binding protein [Polyangiaceae bacterium LLY-WYZ-15_(1-7)]MBJ71997.1 (2Fe-2S)-binding protein [Sandaracinus sp.]HJL06337.1 (2Fe-2S)-binding protein [Polyangiaceae bacterium LLY-WYZ-15_(1-7)]
MLVCHCKGVPCRVIKDCVRQGADDAEAVGRRCGAGTGCGGCKPLLAKLVERERSASVASPAQPAA